ncbi:17813_t:CDS:2 [Acaulospora morrowiae]|uniref:glucan endo-1,3-beta-D-glucosidase n=1 Tax=Acaulospora morrowiae TaxID=94023 RepID=A0A9N8YPQ1_9GLOM|nr:17813_t:CDS:2 [Acaulospora morrowiae]
MVDPDASEWLKSQQRGSRNHRIIIVTLGIIVLMGAVTGIVFSVMKNSHGAPDGSGSGKSGNNNTNTGNDPNNKNPGGNPASPGAKYFTWDNKPVNLTINPDSNLKKSFYGLNYGPVNASFPWCGNTLGDVIEDIKMISQLTSRLRLYGMDCNMADYTLEAILLLKLNITIVPTIWVDDNDTTYQRQQDSFFNLINKYGVDNIDGVSVGNEVIFRKDIPTQKLYQRIADVRSKVNSMGLKKKLPVFTSDLGSNVDSAFVAANDMIWANVHPFFGGVNINQAANWTFTFFKENDVAVAKGKDTIMSEVGWPTAGDSQQGAVPSLQNLQIFLSTFICPANDQVKYYYFETFDAPWKAQKWTILEGSWGLFNPDRSLKSGITLPSCIAP